MPKYLAKDQETSPKNIAGWFVRCSRTHIGADNRLEELAGLNRRQVLQCDGANTFTHVNACRAALKTEYAY